MIFFHFYPPPLITKRILWCDVAIRPLSNRYDFESNIDMWWDIMVSGLILLVFKWHILEITETWTRSKENCSSDATSVYVCEWNKEFWENTTIAIEYIIEWVTNGATASLSLLNTSGSVAMHSYQWLSNMYTWHYMHAFTASHTPKA